jgi:hypothetical protein
MSYGVEMNYMKARLVIVVILLAFAVSLATPSASAKMSLRVDSEKESKLSPEEELEVRRLATRFTEHWRADYDFKQINDEMYVKDFSQRLWRAPQGEMPWWFLDRQLIVHAGGDELQRFYTVTMNFFGLFFRLYEVTRALRQPSETEDESWGSDILSIEVMNVLRSDPTLAMLAQEISGDEDERAKEAAGGQLAPGGNSPQAASPASPADGGGGGAEEDSEEGIIKTIPQLDSVTTTLEKANELLHKQLSSLPPVPQKPASGDDTESRKDSLKVYPMTLDESEYDCMVGTPVVRLTLLPFVLTLTKIEGHFEILTVAIYVD